MKPTLNSPIWSWAALCLALLFIGWGLWLIATAHQLQTEVVRAFHWANQLQEVERVIRKFDSGLPPADPRADDLQGQSNWLQLREQFDALTRKLLETYRADDELQAHLSRLTEGVNRMERLFRGIHEPSSSSEERRRLTLAFRQELNLALDETTAASQIVQARLETLAAQLNGKWRALTLLVMVSCILVIFLALLSTLHLREIGERHVAEDRLRQYRHRLEDLVHERTLAVARANEQLKGELALRQQAEDALRVSENRYRMMSELTSDYFYSVVVHEDGSLETEWVTEAFHRITGYTLTEVNALGGWTQVVCSDDRENYEAFGRALAARRASSLEYRICTKQGPVRWLGDFARPEWDEMQQRVVRVLGAVQDITERKGAEQALQRAHAELERHVTERTAELVETNTSLQREIAERRRAEGELRQAEAKYRSIFESAVEGIYQSTPDGRFLAANPALARIWGYDSPAEMLANLTDLERQLYVDPTRRTVFRQQIETHGEVHAFEYESYRRDGSIIWISEHSRAVRAADGKVLHYEGTIQDITTRKEAEEALRASETKYRALIENLEQSVFLKDDELKFVAANWSFCERLGCSEAELIGKTDYDLYPEPLAQKYRADDLLVLQEGRHVESEEERPDNGSARLVRVVKTPVRDGQGQIVGVLGISWDVTEQRMLETQLRQSQKMEAIGRLAGGVAHDFNNLLTIILGNLSLTLAALPETDTNREFLGIAEQAAVRAAELTRQLLGFSRRALLRPEPLSLNVAVQETLHILRRTIDPRIAVELTTEEHLWTVRADRAQIGQVLMNLCLNARDAMQDGGKLTLDTSNVRLDEDSVRKRLGSPAGEYVRLRVRDTGHGIAPELRAQIFEPFFTTKAAGKGTGLGLAMVFGIVKQHLGWIDCHSDVGKGTCFDIYLPRHDENALMAQPRDGWTDHLAGHETVLLVDDEEQIRVLGAAALNRYGYRVLLAEDGLQAIDTYMRQRDRIDLIVLDLTMPLLSGRDTLAQLLQHDPTVPVLISSGYAAESLSAAESDQTLGFLGKPYRPEELACAVRQALDRLRERASQPESRRETDLGRDSRSAAAENAIASPVQVD